LIDLVQVIKRMIQNPAQDFAGSITVFGVNSDEMSRIVVSKTL
jgi:hypothetical protein